MTIEAAGAKPKYDPTNVAETALHTLKDGNDGPVLALLEQGGDPNQTDKQGSTALHRAAFFNRPALVYGLLRFGANPNPVTQSNKWGGVVGKTPLMTAAGQGFEAVASVLLANRANPNLRNEYGYNALIGAIYAKHDGMVALLRNAETEIGLMEAGWLGEVPLIQALLSQTSPLGEAAESALFGAATMGHQNALRFLLDNGVSPHASESKLHHLPALTRAAQEGHLEIMRLLLDAGADPNQTNTNGMTALGGAVEASCGLQKLHERQRAVVKLLLERGANAAVRSHSGWTPLMVVCMAGDAETAKMLLAHGADPNAFTDEKASAAEGCRTSNALMQAVANARLEAVRVLLDYGANPHAKNSEGNTAFDTAAHYINRSFRGELQDRAEIIELLRTVPPTGTSRPVASSLTTRV